MICNPEAESFFLGVQAHDEAGGAFVESLARLGEYELRGDLRRLHAPYAVTADTVFGGASDLALVYYRLHPRDLAIALASGAEPAPIGPEWVRFVLFRADWPKPDLAHFARRAYDYARTRA